MSIITSLARITQWREAGPLARDLFKEGHKAIASPTDFLTEIVLKEHTLQEMPWHAHYYLHYLPKDFAAGVMRVEMAGRIAKVTDVAVKLRFEGKGHEERMVDLLAAALVKSGGNRLEIPDQSPPLTASLQKRGFDLQGGFLVKKF